MTLAPVATGPAAVGEVVDHPFFAKLEQIEAQAHRAGTARAEYRVTYLPTAPEAAQTIRAVNQLRSQAPDRHVLEAEAARAASYRSFWQCNLTLQREDRTYRSGETVRLIAPRGGRAPQQQSLIQPFSLVCEYLGRPLSEWLRQGEQPEIAEGTVNAQPLVQLAFLALTDEAPLIVMRYDERGRLTSREVYLEDRNYLVESSRYAQRLHARHEFSEFRSVDDGHGGQFWYPAKAMLHYFVGETRDGSEIEQYAIAVEIDKLELGVELGAKAFEGESPPAAIGRALATCPKY